MRGRMLVCLVVVALAGAVAACSTGTTGTSPAAVARPVVPEDLPVPNSMAALGDSITRAYNACGRFEDCPQRSWSTGDDPSVTSQYERLLARNPAIAGHATNLARSGAKAGDLHAQVDAAIQLRPDYVTILIGANDACTSSEANMTAVDQFRTSVVDALDSLRTALPLTRVLVVSIPDIEHLWEVEHRDRVAQAVWYLGDICQSMLRDARDVSTATTERRTRVRERVIAYNEALRAACDAYGPFCRFDGGAVFTYAFTPGNVSAWDHFHPDVTGQAALATVANQAWNW